MDKQLLHQAACPTRRQFAKMLAAQFLALDFVTKLPAQANRPSHAGRGKAKSLIWIRFRGGLSHVDSFDIKEANTEANRASEPIKTNTDGIYVAKYFTGMAKHMNRFALINSMQHTQGVHSAAGYLMGTGYRPSSTVSHPELGAWISKYAERRSGAIPPFIKLGAKGGLGAGFFPGQYGALPIPDPLAGITNSTLPQGVTQPQFQKRFSLTERLNQEFEKTRSNTLTRNYHQAYANAVSLLGSKDLEVFNIATESPQVKAAYGENQFGASCLLARRLVEQGVGCVTLSTGGWDDHADIYDGFATRAGIADQGIASLIADLRSRGLLDTTLVAITTEFGRDAKLNKQGGRGHNPRGFSCLLAGGGIQGGQKYGSTDALGQTAVENIVSPEDLHKTLGYALGLPTEQVEMSPNGRPFTIGNKGKPITALF